MTSEVVGSSARCASVPASLRESEEDMGRQYTGFFALLRKRGDTENHRDRFVIDGSGGAAMPEGQRCLWLSGICGSAMPEW